jgi:hypothetical protein
MKIIIAHAKEDRNHMAAVAHWMSQQGFWVEMWSLAADDSLLFRSRNGLWPTKRLILTLSPEAVAARWIRRELSTRLTMDMLGALVHVPIVTVLLKPCSVPPLLQEWIDADFTCKPFEIACADLYRACFEPYPSRNAARVF